MLLAQTHTYYRGAHSDVATSGSRGRGVLCPPHGWARSGFTHTSMPIPSHRYTQTCYEKSCKCPPCRQLEAAYPFGNPPRQCMQVRGRNAPRSSQTQGSSAHTAPDMKSGVAPALQRSGNLISQHDNRAYPIAGSLINPASTCPDFSHTHLLLRRCLSISLLLFFSRSSHIYALSLHSHTSQFSYVYLLVHSPIPWRFTSHAGIFYTYHPYSCLKCRPSCTHLFCFHTFSALCSLSDTGMSFPVSPCCSCSFYLGTLASSPTVSSLFSTF